MNQENQILESWQLNAKPWIKAIADETIASRKQVTNQAILDVIATLKPLNLWDIGCGEGWLCRKANSLGIQCKGTDAIPELIEAASRQGGGHFEVLKYEDISPEIAEAKATEMVVFNFSLFGKESVEDLITNIKPALRTGSHLVIQTLHPFSQPSDLPYESGWRAGSWAGFSTEFSNPAPWYFRTIGDWVATLQSCGYRIVQLVEPIFSVTKMPASLILVAKPAFG